MNLEESTNESLTDIYELVDDVMTELMSLYANVANKNRIIANENRMVEEQLLDIAQRLNEIKEEVDSI